MTREGFNCYMRRFRSDRLWRGKRRVGIKYRGKGGVDTRRDHENNNRRGAESIENHAGGHGLLGFQSDGLTFFGGVKNGNLKYGLLVNWSCGP